MSLPSPSSGADWNSYNITTPTFQLSPIEKPDMSPFLVHMTGKNEIIQILEGKNAPKKLEEGEGFLKASVPEQLKNNNYKAKVVCFTESPTFALDFFRYRSRRRWETNQNFGIGFDKTSLVSKGIRPVIYADTELMKQIMHDYKYHILDKEISKDNSPKPALVKLLEWIYPLLFPLLEKEKMQGFMWEREWRATQKDGFIFSHKDIKIICCPQEEEEAIKDILGNSANDIQFITTWIQYDDVTKFLERQQQIWRNDKVSLNQQVEQKDEETKQEDKKIEQEDKNIQQIRALIEHKEITNNSLKSYQEFILRLESNKEKVKEESQYITDEINNLKTQLADLEKKKEEKKKVLPDSLLGDTNPAS